MSVADSPVVLGLDFGGTKIAMAVCEPDGELRASTTVSSGGELGARASFDRGIKAVRDVLAAAGDGGRREALAARLAHHHGDLRAAEVKPEHNRGLGHVDLPVCAVFRQDS